MPRHVIQNTDNLDVAGKKVHVRTDTSKRANSLTTAQTTVGTTAVQITTPPEAKNYILKHRDPNITVWIGRNDSVTVGGSEAFPLEGNVDLVLEQFQTDGDNFIYAIADSGSVTVYCMGTFLE